MTTQSYDVRVIRASVNPAGEKIATIVARYPRFIHGEVMTHKDLSRNASSSRAIPFKTMLRLIRKDMAAPIHWGENQPGMQATYELKGFKRKMAIFMWHLTGHVVLTLAWLMWEMTGAHKQVINRMVEPWSYINVQITATNWERVFQLRIDKDAQPEFYQLAYQIREALSDAIYIPIDWGEWHIPWLMVDEMDLDVATQLKLSSARSARLSYTPVGEPTKNVDKDVTLSSGLLKALHLSPFEHQAEAKQGKFANFKGWRNYRNWLGY